MANAKSTGIIPVVNPTGYPYERTIKIPTDVDSIKKL